MFTVNQNKHTKKFLFSLYLIILLNLSHCTVDRAQQKPRITPFPRYTPAPITHTSPSDIFGIAWIFIPEGDVLIGKNFASPFTGDRAEPSHTIFLSDYWISKHEITNAQYQVFVNETNRTPPRYWVDGTIPPGLENHPLSNVSWHDAWEYAIWLGDKLNRSVTLPSEAQWEKAARGVDGLRIYPWGNEIDSEKTNICDVNCIGPGDIEDNSLDDGFEITSPVGTFPEGASPYGVMDMSGNVSEWTRSWLIPYPINPDFSIIQDWEAVKTLDENRVVVRGSAWITPDFGAHYRYHQLPDEKNAYTGFRVVITIEE